VWFFGVIEHWNAECVGWHVCKKGNRFAAMDALSNGMRDHYGSIDSGTAGGLSFVWIMVPSSSLRHS
jgi:putative transposase